MTRQELIAQVRRRRDEVQARLDGILAGAERRGASNLSGPEQVDFDRALAEIREIDGRLADLRGEDEAHRASADLNRRLGLGRAGSDRDGDLTYSRGSGHSYFRDLAMVSLGRDLGEPLQRLQAHAGELDRAANSDRPELRTMWGVGAREVRVNPNRTDGQGGYFAPPIWLIDEYVAYLRAGRQTANLCRRVDLPQGTDSINLPKIASGTATAVQSADAGAVTSVDLTDSAVSAPVRTIAGQQDVAIQLLDQSPIAFDEVILQDLIADYNRQVDLQVLSGTGAAGQLQGILGLAGINSVSYTDTTPTGPELFGPIAQAASQVESQIFRPPSAIVMHPSRWNWLASALDNQNRPLVEPSGMGALNAMAASEGARGEGVVGQLFGLPVVADANIPRNQGAGTNEDRVIVARFPELFLFEGQMRTRALQEVLSGTLQVRFQVYNYCAFIPDRYPAAVSVISGTGLVSPAGF